MAKFAMHLFLCYFMQIMNSVLGFAVRHLAPEEFSLPVDTEFEDLLLSMQSEDFERLYKAFESPGVIKDLWQPETSNKTEVLDKERFLTPATCMTIGRPILALEVGKKLVKGETGATKWLLAMGATDAEGSLARAIDKIRPNSGLGCTERGKKYDPIADTLAFLIVSSAALKAPRISKPAKLAVATVLGAELYKSIWAVQSGLQHRRTTGQELVISPSRTGKLATVEKFMALGFAVLTNDLEPGWQRNLASAGALAAAGLGAIHGEKARRSYLPLIGKS